MSKRIWMKLLTWLLRQSRSSDERLTWCLKYIPHAIKSFYGWVGANRETSTVQPHGCMWERSQQEFITHKRIRGLQPRPPDLPFLIEGSQNRGSSENCVKTAEVNMPYSSLFSRYCSASSSTQITAEKHCVLIYLCSMQQSLWSTGVEPQVTHSQWCGYMLLSHFRKVYYR